jgi:hypothetical protein
MEEQNTAPNTDTENIGGTETTPKTPFQQFLEHQGNAAQESVKALQALIPPEFKAHSRKAREEFLQSFKVLVDGVQEAVNREMEKAKAAREKQNNDNNGPTTTGKSKVKVEVS